MQSNFFVFLSPWLEQLNHILLWSISTSYKCPIVFISQELNIQVTRGTSRFECFVYYVGRATLNIPAYPIHRLLFTIQEENRDPQTERGHLCNQCYAEVGKGLPHQCSKLNKQKNLSVILKQASPNTQG